MKRCSLTVIRANTVCWPVAMADRWYVVGVNAQKEPLKLSLNLPMWEKGETVSYYLDDKKRQLQLEELKIKNPAEVKVVIQPEGGIILTK